MKFCVIITTINKPTDTIIKHIDNKKYDLIIVGDKKTPNDYYNLDCIYLDINKQKELFPELADIIPYNHYSRKNLGYLYAIINNYDLIYETDDDNVPYDNFDNVLNELDYNDMINCNNKWINVFKYFTNNSHIWPRGYPLSLIKCEQELYIEKTEFKPSIINGLVENDPDVDALFRLISKDNIKWEKDKKVLISNKTMAVFNTQNTFWLNKNIFICLLIPSTVSFRYCDILKGIIANIVLKYSNNYLMITSPNVIQYRNEHNLMSDFKSEVEMYINNENILNFIEDGINEGDNIKTIISKIYDNLLKNNVISKLDIDILNIWLNNF